MKDTRAIVLAAPATVTARGIARFSGDVPG